MYSILFNDKKIKVKASIIRLYNKKTKKCTHVFSVFECIEPDMQIRNDHSDFFASRSADSPSGEKVFYTEQIMELDENLLADPLSNFIIPNTKDESCDKFEFINSEFIKIPESDDSYLLSCERTASGFDCLFPDVNVPTWIKTWVDHNRETYKFFQKDKKLLKQLEDVSKEKLGFNLADYYEHIGSMVLKWNHRQVRSIDIQGVSEPHFGITLDINYRTSLHPKLKYEICQIEQGDCVVYNQSGELNNIGYKHIIDLPVVPNFFLLQIYDEENNLIYHRPCNGLIQKFSITMSVPSKAIDGVSVENANGETSSLPRVQKWSSEKSVIGNSISSMNNYYLEAQKIRNVFNDEKNGQFIFFDGSRNKKEYNKENARKYVQKLLNRASTRCMICDDFFDAPDFGNYLYHVKNEEVELRVMSSLGDIHRDGAIRLANVIDEYNRAIGSNRAIGRMLKGDRSVLHDRFIVCDDEIWAVGASFNELGARASVIYRIPAEAGKIIISKLEEWWKDDDISVDVHDI